MGASKLKVLHVMIIGPLVCVLVAVGLYFVMIQGKTETIKKLQTNKGTLDAKVAELPGAEAQLARAKSDYSLAKADFERYMKEKMPSITFEDRMAGLIAYWDELLHVLGPKIQAWPEKTGVHLQTAVQLPPPPTDPNFNSSLIVIPLGTFQVTGSYDKILSHIESWNRFDRLVQVDPVSLSGESPNMTGSYNLTLYIYPHGKAGPTIGLGGGGGAAAGGGMGGMDGGMMPGMGGPGMMPGMMPGMPGMGGPGMKGGKMGGPGMMPPGMMPPGMGPGGYGMPGKMGMKGGMKGGVKG